LVLVGCQLFFFFQAEDGIRDLIVTGVQTCALPICLPGAEIPAGGYLTTLADLARFVEMLRRGGELDGARILSPAMLEFATRNHRSEERRVGKECRSRTAP